MRRWILIGAYLALVALACSGCIGEDEDDVPAAAPAPQYEPYRPCIYINPDAVYCDPVYTNVACFRTPMCENRKRRDDDTCAVDHVLYECMTLAECKAETGEE